MARHTGIASLPLRSGQAPRWLFSRMVRLSREIRKTLTTTYERAPEDLESLLGIQDVGPKTVRALALASGLLQGAPASLRDPRFVFAHGGKDGTPFPRNG